jgi:hypothetical protein
VSKSRQATRKRVRCQVIAPIYDAPWQSQCRNIATGYIRVPAKFFICSDCRKAWEMGAKGFRFNPKLEPMQDAA